MKSNPGSPVISLRHLPDAGCEIQDQTLAVAWLFEDARMRVRP